MSNIIHVTARVSATAQHAFAMFTANEKLQSWLCERADVEPRIGGKYECFWPNSDEPNQGTLGCKITALTPGELIAFDWKGPAIFDNTMNSATPLTHVVVTFTASGDLLNPTTAVHLLHTGWGNSPEWQSARSWFQTAWSYAFQALERATTPALT